MKLLIIILIALFLTGCITLSWDSDDGWGLECGTGYEPSPTPTWTVFEEIKWRDR